MKKLILALSVVILAACGGGGDGKDAIVPAPGVPAANVYNAMDGSWSCSNPNKPGQDFTMSVAFSGVQAAWSGVWEDGHEAYVVYNDIADAVGATLFYSERRTDVTTDLNTISFDSPPAGTGVGKGKGPITFSIADESNWLLPYEDRVWECVR
jgi:hypothetical protein